MGDEVLPESGLPDGATMRVLERAVTLPGGVVVWLRRWTEGEQPGVREMLADGRWCASRGGVRRMYAAGVGPGGHQWVYRAAGTFESWQAALDAAIEAEGDATAPLRVAAAQVVSGG
jgi:hypothetical protein